MVPTVEDHLDRGLTTEDTEDTEELNMDGQDGQDVLTEGGLSSPPPHRRPLAKEGKAPGARRWDEKAC